MGSPASVLGGVLSPIRSRSFLLNGTSVSKWASGFSLTIMEFDFGILGPVPVPVRPVAPVNAEMMVFEVEASSVPVKLGVVPVVPEMEPIGVGPGLRIFCLGVTMKYNCGGSIGRVYSLSPIRFHMLRKSGVSGGTLVRFASNQS